MMYGNYGVRLKWTGGSASQCPPKYEGEGGFRPIGLGPPTPTRAYRDCRKAQGITVWLDCGPGNFCTSAAMWKETPTGMYERMRQQQLQDRLDAAAEQARAEAAELQAAEDEEYRQEEARIARDIEIRDRLERKDGPKIPVWAWALGGFALAMMVRR